MYKSTSSNSRDPRARKNLDVVNSKSRRLVEDRFRRRLEIFGLKRERNIVNLLVDEAPCVCLSEEEGIRPERPAEYLVCR